MPDFPLLTRRRFLRQTVGFSAVAALRPHEAFGQIRATPRPDPAAATMLMIGDWGTDKYIDQQIGVSKSMQLWSQNNKITPAGMFLLGDNWYGDMPGGLTCPRWKTQFEEMYPVADFPGPAYAVLGNHDYERHPVDKVELQLAYPKSTTTRWTMPSRWYTFQFPEKNPIVTFICLDSNLPGTKPFDLHTWSYLMHHEERDQQNEWFKAELAKPRTTPFVAVVCHHPLYTNGVHKDNHILISEWDQLLRDHKVDFYITGHDHDLQHLEFAGHPTSFVVSGGGGAELVDWSTPPEKRGPWGGRVQGFTAMEMTPQAITLRHLGLAATELHAFRKSVGGGVEILKSV